MIKANHLLIGKLSVKHFSATVIQCNYFLQYEQISPMLKCIALSFASSLNELWLMIRHYHYTLFCKSILGLMQIATSWILFYLSKGVMVCFGKIFFFRYRKQWMKKGSIIVSDQNIWYIWLHNFTDVHEALLHLQIHLRCSFIISQWNISDTLYSYLAFIVRFFFKSHINIRINIHLHILYIWAIAIQLIKLTIVRMKILSNI